MSRPAIGNLDAMLRRLETRVTQLVPRCEFYFGYRDELQRQKTGPYVVWHLRGGEPFAPRDIKPRNQFATMDDLVLFTARCVGLVPAGELGPDPRRQQTEAGIQVFLAVQLAVHEQHQGWVDDRGWQPVGLDLVSDANVAIDYTFAVRAGRLTQPLGLVQATSAPATVELEP